MQCVYGLCSLGDGPCSVSDYVDQTQQVYDAGCRMFSSETIGS